MTATSDMRRHAIGLIAAGLLAAAALLWLWQPGGNGEMWAFAFLRTGFVSAAAWLAWPQIGRIHPWLLLAGAGGLLGLLYVARQPRTLALAAVIVVLVFKLRPAAPPRSVGR